MNKVFDTGRFHLALRDGLESQSAAEIEPVDHPVILQRSGIIDACRYPHALPRAVK